ncbi:MAG: MFS transporter, partial [Trebonia sp.]
MPPFLLSCLAYLGVALPGSTLGLLWPSMRMSIHEPVGALGVVLAAGVAASAVSSATTGRILRTRSPGPTLAIGAALISLALAVEAAASWLWLIAAGSAVFSIGFGAVDTALNVYAAAHFGPKAINWIHASYGLGATLGPLLVTALLAAGADWRAALASMAAVTAAIVVVAAVARHKWNVPPADFPAPERAALTPHRPGILPSVLFTAVETGVESAAGIWGYAFLTSGRGLSPVAAGIVVSAYWAMMFVGRVLLGPVAQRAGASHVLALAVVGVPGGALLMALPLPAGFAVAGMAVLGLAAAPVFPLITLVTGGSRGEGPDGGAATAVGLQVAASAVGSAALPSAVGLAVGAFGGSAVGPSLLTLSLAMCAVYWAALRILLAPCGVGPAVAGP